jgi:redox-sensing transcriptional repressor
VADKIPEATLIRLTQIYRALSRVIRFEDDVVRLSSSQIADLIGTTSHTIRKDISCLGEVGNSGKGYDVQRLYDFLAEKLGLSVDRKTAVVGLGKIGTALMEYGRFSNVGFDLKAGFDADTNRVDTIVTDIPVYPAYDIAEIIAREKIELAFLTTPAGGAEKSVERLVEGGIKGIVNFSPITLKSENVFIRNVDLSGELTLLSALISLNEK